MELLAYAPRGLPRETHTRLRNAAPIPKNVLLGDYQLTLDNGRIGPGQRKFLDTRASSVGSREGALDVNRTPTQYVFDSCSSCVNLRKPSRIGVEAR